MNGIFHLPLLLDGATGTNLFRAGMPSGVCVEEWVLAHPQVLTELQKAYVQAGSGAVMAPTFEANRYKLARFGLEGMVKEFNRRLVALSRAAVGPDVLVAGDISPTGLFTEPFGDTTFDELTDIFREQSSALKDAGADYIAVETVMGLTEARAALLAAKETGLPVTVTLTVENNGRTLSGGSIASALVTLAAMGADAVGVNCSTGPEAVLAALHAASPYLGLPLVAKPNAGLPMEGKAGVYDITPAQFAAYLPEFQALGAGLIGGCCGTTPEHIALLREALKKTPCAPKIADSPVNENGGLLAVSERAVFSIHREKMPPIRELACDGSFADALAELAGEDVIASVAVSDGRALEEFTECAYLAAVPVQLVSNSADILEGALKVYQGRALLSHDSARGSEKVSTLARRYGAAVL